MPKFQIQLKPSTLYSIKLVSPVKDKLRQFAMPRKIEDQSFCFSGLTGVDFQEVFTDRGICYAFNIGVKIFRQHQSVLY